MPRYSSPGGIPELTYLARKLGDFSSAHRTYLGDPRLLADRVTNRVLGRVAGRMTGMASGAAGVFGVVLLGQFFAALRHWVEYKASHPVWVGTMASYAQAHDNRGWYLNGTFHQPHYFFTKAIIDVQSGRQTQNSPLSSLFKPPQFVDRKGRLDIRGGIYGGQRFVSDFGSFVNGSIVQRVGRRMGGQDVSAFFWGTLRHPERNPAEVVAWQIQRKAKANLREGNHIDTYMLHDSIVVAPTQVELHHWSIGAAILALRRHDREDEAPRRIGAKQSGGSGYFWANYTGGVNATTGAFIP